MKAEVLEGCIGCGVCEGACPSVFRVGEDNVAHVIGAVTAQNESDAREAADSCPVSVILVQ